MSKSDWQVSLDKSTLYIILMQGLMLGSGCVVHIPQFFHELAALEKHNIDTTGRIFVDKRAHIILNLHTQV